MTRRQLKDLAFHVALEMARVQESYAVRGMAAPLEKLMAIFDDVVRERRVPNYLVSELRDMVPSKLDRIIANKLQREAA